MLLTITYKGHDTKDLGFLLHKNPDRAQQFEMSFDKAYVFYPQVSDESTTAALLLDIDPIDLAKGKSNEGGLFDYVNDRPYASTSFMSTAIVRIFGTAMNGRCDKRPGLAEKALDLTAVLTSLRDNGDEELAKELFEPLGYTVTAQRELLDDNFPEWGKSPYITLTISGTVRLSELLNHLYVLIPVFDRQKHYYIDESEIRKLLDHGEGWLETHPYKEKIARRYFKAKQSYARKVIEKLMQDDSDIIETETHDNDKQTRTPLNTLRMQAVRDAVINSGAHTVIDLGCGECRLTSLLLSETQINKVAACDVSVSVLEKAVQRLRPDNMPAVKRNKLELFQASLTYKDSRFEGYDCACAVEVIEHIEPARIDAFERAVFEFAMPHTVIITTPNREYNINYENMKPDALRHGDHRFEWTRDEFKLWTEHICSEFGYTCMISGIGEDDGEHGTPTQMAVFTKAG